jgi:hypothetical protein
MSQDLTEALKACILKKSTQPSLIVHLLSQTTQKITKNFYTFERDGQTYTYIDYHYPEAHLNGFLSFLLNNGYEVETEHFELRDENGNNVNDPCLIKEIRLFLHDNGYIHI